MSYPTDSGKMPFDEVETPAPPLTDREMWRLRQILLADDRATWARKVIRRFFPYVVAVVVATAGAVDYVVKHWRP